MRRGLSGVLLLVALAGCDHPSGAVTASAPAAVSAEKSTETPLGTTPVVRNPEAPIPPQCYTRTAGVANPCWTCHTTKNGNNLKADWTLQEVYAFSAAGLKNHWATLFEDRRQDIAAIADADVQRYIREDNLAPWLATRPAGAPRIDFAKGFDAEGFARDGSGWRALRYQPFPGTFWPTNGASDDIYVRLPEAFHRDAQGQPSRAIAKLNLAVLEAALAVPDTVGDADLVREVEPVDEALAGIDLDGDGKRGTATVIRGLPAHYFGAAQAVPVHRWDHPAGTEYIHTVRYLDPDAPGWLSPRLKEFRYAIKYRDDNPSNRAASYQESAEEKLVGRLPWFQAGEYGGLRNALSWEYRGWIEDAKGALRPQNYEETLACMGCHGGIGITVDSGFGLPRKLPGAAGWTVQSLVGQKDRPQAGHAAGETLTYFQRVGGGDEFRANTEMQARFFPKGTLDEARVRRAAPGGVDDLASVLLPSRERALALNKAYWLLVRDQRFSEGRWPVLAPAKNVFTEIRNGDTALRAQQRVYSDGRLWLDWRKP